MVNGFNRFPVAINNDGLTTQLSITIPDSISSDFYFLNWAFSSPICKPAGELIVRNCGETEVYDSYALVGLKQSHLPSV